MASAGTKYGMALDPDSQAWLARLDDGGPNRQAALEELHALLLRAALFVLRRRRAQVAAFPREELDDLAVEAADEALMAIITRLDEYRGDSRFTTWAWKFAFFEASEAIRRRNWMSREIPSEDAGWSAFAREASPEGALEQRELLAALRAGVEHALTPRQRAVFVALALNDVPVDVLAERMHTTRGALYKMLHEARSRLRAHLAGSTHSSPN
ncbi:MAG TPA: sigma-70 family RNA polymerase sigma factor [Gaiellaceae bacterium]|nr:sigma-70 family RNA polymerase sigma factor [Gaiellaceae bacterium]